MTDNPASSPEPMPPDPTSPEAREFFATVTADLIARITDDIDTGRIPPEHAKASAASAKSTSRSSRACQP